MLLSLGRRKELEKTVSDYVSSKASVFGKDEGWQQNLLITLLTNLNLRNFRECVFLIQCLWLGR